ncbi:uncharacterized protein JCM6883_001137 [Sporobolomyces salmoneus]|uniref:uncharacterized protein n=1 Tax=Sporobolomyces salmoneus TaxID=183962 RepID=UPI00317DDEBC
MSLYGPSYQPRNKLRREGIERTVLPPLPGGHTYSAAYTYAGVGHTGYQKTASSSASVLTGGSRGGGLLSGSASGLGSSTGARVRERIEEVKERQKERRERHKTRTRPDEIQKSNLVVDSEGVHHDSEYVQFRTATPVHVQARTARRNRREVEGIPNDDDSASSASSSSSSSQGSGFQSSPYTYQSTHRTTSTSQNHHHHHSSSLYPPTRSAIPGYLSTQNGRSSLDGGGALTVPRAPSPSKRSSHEYDRSSLDRGGSGSSLRPSASRLRPAGGQQFSTSSFQPPAAFNPVPPSMQLSANQPPLRNSASIAQLPSLGSADAQSLTSSTARLSLGGTANPNESGYNKFARSEKQRGDRQEGNVLDAGVHGMKRSWDGFKLDMRFGAHKVGKKVSRKVTSAIG